MCRQTMKSASGQCDERRKKIKIKINILLYEICDGSAIKFGIRHVTRTNTRRTEVKIVARSGGGCGGIGGDIIPVRKKIAPPRSHHHRQPPRPPSPQPSSPCGYGRRERGGGGGGDGYGGGGDKTRVVATGRGRWRRPQVYTITIFYIQARIAHTYVYKLRYYIEWYYGRVEHTVS